MFYNLCDLEKLAHHIHTHQPHGRELAFALGALASGSATDNTQADTMDLVAENISHLHRIGEGRYSYSLLGAMSAALRGEKNFEQFITELPEE